MSKIRTKTATAPDDASYTKTIAAIAAILLLLMAAFWLLGQTYRYQISADTTAMKSNHKDVPASDANPKFVDLGTFTAHMSDENGEQIIQTSLSLKLTQPGLEARAKASLPEIQHHVNMVLQSKNFSELAARENREKLAQQVKQHVEYTLGFRRTSPKIIVGAWADAVPAVRDNGVAAVLFTSFVIQH
jgi:flagellar basal body-associated protein FliL